MLGSVCAIIGTKHTSLIELKDAFTQFEVETKNAYTQIFLETKDASAQAIDIKSIKSQYSQCEPIEDSNPNLPEEEIETSENQELEEVYDSEHEFVYAEEVNEGYSQPEDIEQFQVEFIDEENGNESEKSIEEQDQTTDDTLMEYIEYDEVAEEQTLEAEYYYDDEEKVELIDESGDEHIIESNNHIKRECRVMTKDPRQVQRRRSNKDPKDSAEYTFKCWVETCNSAFTFRSSMKRHLKSVHSIEVSSSTCMICGLPFKIYHDYLSHIKTHTRKFECDLCKLTFVSIERLESHSFRFHKPNDERPFVCTVN